MKESEPQHVLAQLRLSLGFSRQEVGQLLDCSHHLIQSVEIGRVPLSGTMLARAVETMGISREWLAANDLSEPPVNLFGEEYTLGFFERWRAGLVAPPDAFWQANMAGKWFRLYEVGRRVSDKLDKQEFASMWVEVTTFFEKLQAKHLGSVKYDCNAGSDPETLELVALDAATTAGLAEFMPANPADVNKATLRKLERVVLELKKHLRQTKG